MYEKKLIITADDFGMSLGVNKAILSGIDNGFITSTNVMVNMPFYNQALELKKRKCSVGLHWVLTCGNPVSDPAKIPSLVQSDGSFFSYSTFRKKYRKGEISNNDIITELTSQYKKYVELLGEPDYWNTHENVHVDFKIYSLFVDLAKSLSILKMRSHQRIYVSPLGNDSKPSFLWLLVEPVKSKLLDIWQNHAHRKGVMSPNGLIVCLNENDLHNIEHLVKNIKWKNQIIGELVIHPSTTIDSEFFGKMCDNRIIEYTISSSSKSVSIVNDSGLRLVCYDDV